MISTGEIPTIVDVSIQNDVLFKSFIRDGLLVNKFLFFDDCRPDDSCMPD